MPNFDQDQNVDDTMIDRRDAISDPTDLSYLFKSTGGFPSTRTGAGMLSPTDAAISIGKWYNSAIGNKPANDQAPEGSMAADAGYNSIGQGYDDGGQVGLPPVPEEENTNETPNTLGGQTGTNQSDDELTTGGLQMFPPRTEQDKSSNPDLASYLFNKATAEDKPQAKEGVDYTGTPAYENAKAEESPFAPGNISKMLPKTNLGQYGTVARRLAQEVTDYIYGKHGNDLQALTGGGPDTMDHGTAEVIRSSVNKDGSHPNEGEAALQAAFDKGGPDTAAGLLQSSVQAYNSARAYASVAYDSQNMTASVDAMNKAFKYLPLPESLHFTQGNNGNVIATVIDQKNPDNPPISYNLPRENFRELARGMTGFGYDVIMRGVSPVLAQLSQENHGLWADPNSQGVKPSTVMGAVPDTYKSLGINQAMWNQAAEMFPSVGQNQQRLQFLQGLIQTKQKYTQELEVAKQQGLNRAQVAALTGASRQNVAETQAGSREKVQEERNQGNKEVAGIRALSYDQRTLQVAKTANDKMLQTASTAAEQIKARQKDTVLNGLLKGTMTPDDADTFLKRNGSSLKELLGTPQQAPTTGAPVQGGQGAAQVTQPKGGQWMAGPDPKNPTKGAYWKPNP